MDRRDFLIASLLAAGGILLDPRGAVEAWAKPISPVEVKLTIDDGPYHVPLITKALPPDNYVTHFIVGRNLAGHEEECIDAIVAGHAFGNHTENHHAFSDQEYPFSRLKEDVQKTKEAIGRLYAAAGQKDPLLIRPPYGDLGYVSWTSKGVKHHRGSQARKDAVKEFLEEEGYTVVLWKRDTEDWKCYSKDYTWNAADALGRLKGMRGGEEILAHDRNVKNKSSLIVVQSIIPYLIQNNYRTVLVKEHEKEKTPPTVEMPETSNQSVEIQSFRR